MRNMNPAYLRIIFLMKPFCGQKLLGLRMVVGLREAQEDLVGFRELQVARLGLLEVQVAQEEVVEVGQVEEEAQMVQEEELVDLQEAQMDHQSSLVATSNSTRSRSKKKWYCTSHRKGHQGEEGPRQGRREAAASFRERENELVVSELQRKTTKVSAV